MAIASWPYVTFAANMSLGSLAFFVSLQKNRLFARSHFVFVVVMRASSIGAILQNEKKKK